MRTQIDLRPEQHARAKAKAAALGITLAEYLRRLVDRDLHELEPVSDPSAIFALGNSGGSDIANEINARHTAGPASKFDTIAQAIETHQRTSRR
jgi:hypothetical protein